MKKSILLTVFIGFATPTVSSVIAYQKKPATPVKKVRHCVWNTIKIGAGLVTSAVGLPFCSIGLLSTGFKSLADQEHTILYEYDAQTCSEQPMGQAKYLCDFLVFLKHKIGENPEEQAEVYIPMFKNGNKLTGLGIPIDENTLNIVDQIVKWTKRVGFITGVPMVVCGLLAIRNGIRGIAKEFRKTKKENAAKAIA